MRHFVLWVLPEWRRCFTDAFGMEGLLCIDHSQLMCVFSGRVLSLLPPEASLLALYRR